MKRRLLVVGVLIGVAVVVWWIARPTGPAAEADAMADSVCACDDAACVAALQPERAALDEAFHAAYPTLGFDDIAEIRAALDRVRDCEARFAEHPAL